MNTYSEQMLLERIIKLEKEMGELKENHDGAETEEFYQFCFDEFNLTENGIKDFLRTWEKEVRQILG